MHYCKMSFPGVAVDDDVIDVRFTAINISDKMVRLLERQGEFLFQKA